MDPRDYPEEIKRRRGRGNRHPVREDRLADMYRDDRRTGVGHAYYILCLPVCDIAKEFGISVATALRDVEAYRETNKAKDAPALRAKADADIAAVIAGHMEKARAGDAESGRLVLQAYATHAKILGYEAPTQVTGKDGGPIEVSHVTADEILARISRIAGENAGSGASENTPEPVKH